MFDVNVKKLYGEEEIARRVSEMGKSITEYYAQDDLTVIVLTNGAVPFAADLIRRIELPIWVDSLAVASYHADKRGDEIQFRSKLKLNPTNRRVLLVDEVLDSGRTLKHVGDYLMEHGAKDVRSAVIVQKDMERGADALQKADWIGFICPCLYLVGYGLDSNEIYRNLPYIGVLEK